MANEFAVIFTTTPRDAEYFVGSEAILQWEYSSRPSNAVRKVKFGIVALPEDSASASEDVAIFVKDKISGDVQRNTKYRTDVIASLNGRTSVLKNETASFKIANLTMNDTGKYFCRLEPDISISAREKTHYVHVKVVGKSKFKNNFKFIPDSTAILENIYRADSVWRFLFFFFLMLILIYILQSLAHFKICLFDVFVCLF